MSTRWTPGKRYVNPVPGGLPGAILRPRRSFYEVRAEEVDAAVDEIMRKAALVEAGIEDGFSACEKLLYFILASDLEPNLEWCNDV